MTPCVDLNADLGEGMPGDAELIDVVTSANIACGLHAGDDGTMARTVEWCLARGVAIGAHPSFDDREGFGRREMRLPSGEVRTLVQCQVAALDRIARRAGGALSHVKPHGALYNLAAKDAGLAAEIAAAVRDFDPELLLVGLAGSELVAQGEAAGLRVAREVFADRGYRADGSLVPRSQPGALVEDGAQAVRRAMGMVLDGTIESVDGTAVPLRAETICVHGDTPGAAALARTLREALEAAGIDVRRIA